MKTVLAVSVFCHVVAMIRSSSHFEDLTAVKLAELKRQWKEVEQPNTKLTVELAKLIDEGVLNTGKRDTASSAGLGPGEFKALQNVVYALREKIIPAISKARKQRDEEIEDYAEHLVEMLRKDASRRDLKEALGKTVIEMHQKCDDTQKYFLKMANMSGLFQVLRQAVGQEEDLDFVTMLNEAKEGDEESEGFDALQEMFEQLGQGKKVNPMLKSFLLINKLLSHATCGDAVEGLIEKMEDIVDEEDPDHEPFPNLEDKIVPFLGLNKTRRRCKEGLIDFKDGTPVSLKKKMMALALHAQKKKLCKDVPAVLRYLNITLEAIHLGKRVAILMLVDHKQKAVLIEKIKSLLEHRLHEEAAKLVGAAVLDGLRKDLLVGLALKKLGKDKPSSSLPSKPRKPSDVSAVDRILDNLETKNDPRYGME